MSKWKETNKYGIHESKAAYWRYTRQRDKEAEILKELEPQPPHACGTDRIRRLHPTITRTEGANNG